MQNEDNQFSVDRSREAKSGSVCARFKQNTHTGSGVYDWGSSLKLCSTSLKLTFASGAHLPVLLPSDKMTMGI